MSDRLMLCSDPVCPVRSLWTDKVPPDAGFIDLRCPQCNGPLKVDPAPAHNDEAFALLDEVLLYLENIEFIIKIECVEPASKGADLRQRIAKHLGGNR